MPGLHSALDTVSGVSSDLKSALEDASATADQMQGVMDQLSKSLTEGSEALGKTGDTHANLVSGWRYPERSGDTAGV